MPIAFYSLRALLFVVKRDPPAFALLPSPIYSSSSPHQQYSGISFLAALIKKLRIVFSDLQTNLPTDPSFLTKYIQLMKDDHFLIDGSLAFCSGSFLIPDHLLISTPPVKVDSEIIRELILFVKETLPTVLTNISNIDTLIASFPSDSSLATLLISGDRPPMIDWLKELRNRLEVIVCDSWSLFVSLTFNIADPNKSSFPTIILDDPSFPEVILNSLKLSHINISWYTFVALTNIVIQFETVDFVSPPLSEPRNLFQLTRFIVNMFHPIGDNEAEYEQYRHFQVSVFEQAKRFITFIFHNSDKLILSEEDSSELEKDLCWIRLYLIHISVRSDEHNSDIVDEILKWIVRETIKMGVDDPFRPVFEKILTRACEWRRNKEEQQKRPKIDWDLIPDLIEFMMDKMKSSLSPISSPDSLIPPLQLQTVASPPHTHLESVDNDHAIVSLNELRDGSIDDVENGWILFYKLILSFPSPHQPAFETIVLDDPFFSDLVVRSLTLNRQTVT
ncbi:hypothetical protein BLNAU_12379 [Blattamonas nauphoetae]|uniref:Uncharacterized protein n=1 Tax=Blattamonas nauphoetae TaxID=2049346 RepID=A0ABQ9XMK7_9EUKA|nr:hypothetical protein BLNAU_12379 [Blattamonas nauphoetae]